MTKLISKIAKMTLFGRLSLILYLYMSFEWGKAICFQFLPFLLIWKLILSQFPSHLDRFSHSFYFRSVVYIFLQNKKYFCTHFESKLLVLFSGPKNFVRKKRTNVATARGNENPPISILDFMMNSISLNS